MNCGKLTPLRGVLILLAIWLVIPGTREARADQPWPLWWQEKVRKLKADGKDVKIMRSKSMKPEKSPEEFLKRYKKVRGQAGKNFTFETFVEDISRGLVIEQRYHETKGVLYNAKENLNPNYYWKDWKSLYFNYDKFCITPELLRKIFGKENRIITYQGSSIMGKTLTYDYHEMDMRFDVDYIPGINKECARETKFDSDLFFKMENRKRYGGEE